MKYLSTTQVAEKWGLSARRVALLCKQEGIEGAQKAGSNWSIPEDAESPPIPELKAENI